MKVVIVPDSYKGCLTSMQVADAIGSGIQTHYPDAQIIKLNASDGGDGMLESFVTAAEYLMQYAETHDALMHPVTARWARKGDTAIIESAQAIGLHLLEETERDLMKATSYGLGEIILHAIKAGCKKIIVGLGGTATNDGGVGMLQALGVRFYDSNHHLLDNNRNQLPFIASYDDSGLDSTIKNTNIIIASDVNNPLCGNNGATYIYGPQKQSPYLTKEERSNQLSILEKAMRNLSANMTYKSNQYHSHTKGVGAAGGIGYALLTLCNAKIKSGSELLFETIGLERIIADADYVITGEGCSDEQTLMGKLPVKVLDLCKSIGKPCILISGAVNNAPALLDYGFSQVYAVTPDDIPLSQALQPDIATCNIISCVSKIKS